MHSTPPGGRPLHGACALHMQQAFGANQTVLGSFPFNPSNPLGCAPHRTPPQPTTARRRPSLQKCE
eukprot:10501454-Karenia_brevis.AAC.1